MNLPIKTPYEERVLVLAPTPTDAALTMNYLTEAELGCHICPDLIGLCGEIDRGAGAILLTEEVMASADSRLLVEALSSQPPWSDIPILLLANRGATSPVATWTMDLLGNVTILERPIRLTTLISSLRAALRARRRQYELRAQVETLRTREKRLRLLWEAAAVLLTTEHPDVMMRELFAKIGPHLDLDAYFNFMVDDTGAALKMVSCIGIPDEAARSIERLALGQAICGAVAQSRRPITAVSIQQSDDPRVQLVKAFGIRAYACNPLMAGDRLLGTLSFASRSKDHFDADELEFLQTVCQYVAYAYERLRLIQQLRSEDVKKDEFLATLAHELRNPLAPIRNAVQFFRLKAPSDPDLRIARDIIDRQVRQMTRLVDDLLDISRITRGKIVLQRERVSLGVVLTNAVESSRPLIEKADHDFTLSLPPETITIDGDATRLGQVFGNLLANAAKYTDRNGHIELAAAADGDNVKVTVSDSGIGIAPEHLPQVFEMFSQIEPALERSQGGLGIGLALVKNLVELHGGHVEAHSKGLNCGSQFIVTLPLAAPLVKKPPSGVRPIPLKSCDQARCRILVADDNIDSAQSLTLMLTVMGHELLTAYDGAKAVEVAKQTEPDVILLDIGMPRMNGYEAARQIRKQEWAKRTLLVALTGWGQEEDKRRAEEAGFDHHFTKPIDPAALERILASRARQQTAAP